MARYTIEDTTLTALGDAVRIHVGETRPGTAIGTRTLVAINKNPRGAINSLLPELGSCDNYTTTTIAGAVKLQVNIKFSLQNWYTNELMRCKVYVIPEICDAETFLEDKATLFMKGNPIDGLSYTTTLIYENTDSITIRHLQEDVPADLGFIGYRAEITGYDVNGNEITESYEYETEVKNTLTVAQMTEEINNLSIMPPEALYLTGDLTSRFAYNGWNWFIEQFGDKIITENIISLNSTFVNSSQLKEIPFDLHCRISSSGNSLLGQAFSGCSALTKFPNIYIHTKATSASVMLDKGINEEQNIFLDDNVSIYGFEYNTFTSSKFKEEPEWLFSQCDWDQIRTNTKGEFGTGFPLDWSQAYYIKELPSFPNFYSEGTSNYYSHWYSLKITSCYHLQNIILPRPGKCAYSSSPNAFGGGFTQLTSLKNLTFDVQEDGTPYTAQWKNTTLSLHNYVGFAYASSYMNVTKRVTDDESYQRLKNDPAYWTSQLEYACYNHNSAVNTINSLPDTSAYGTNTIKFKGAAGSATDGGAINTLTEEEIAVATAKGWTVTFV